jgi:hypothetical protein
MQPAPAAEGDLRRVFVVTAARTGSTLLAAVLADAGAEFGMPAPRLWDRAGGALEHADLWRALRYFRAAADLSTGRPAFGLARMRWNVYRSLGKKWLRAGLGRARFVKVYGAHDLVRPAFKLGYFPVVILSYRRFEDQALSFGLMHAHASWESLGDNYRHVYRNGLWLLATFGGCVVAYENLTDRADVSWAEPLARATGLPAARLIEARDRRLEEASAPAAVTGADPATDEIFAAMQLLRGQAIAPSHQAQRTWQSMRARQPAASRGAARQFAWLRSIGDA